MDDLPVALTADEFSSAVTAITSAFGDPTRRRIYLYVHENPDGVAASAVAAAFDLHPNVARHHLDKLAGGGYLEVRTGAATGLAGRPSKLYAPTETTMTLDVPVRQDDVVLALLGRALDRLPPDVAEALAEEVGVEFGQAMAASLGPKEGGRSMRAALHAVADALTAHGFAAHSEGQGAAARIVADHCPFGGAGVASPVICAVDRGMVKGMLGALHGGEVTSLTARSRARGDDTCVTAVTAVAVR